MSKSVLLSYIIIADVTRIKGEIKIEKKTHKNTILSGANSQATELSSATGRKLQGEEVRPVRCILWWKGRKVSGVRRGKWDGFCTLPGVGADT